MQLISRHRDGRDREPRHRIRRSRFKGHIARQAIAAFERHGNVCGRGLLERHLFREAAKLERHLRDPEHDRGHDHRHVDVFRGGSGGGIGGGLFAADAFLLG